MPRGQNCYMSDRVSITIDNGIADVRLTRADKRNALDSEMFRAIAAAGERLKTQAGVRCVVLSGEGKSFCAGLDMGSMNQLAGAPPANGEEQTNAGDINDGSITHLAQQICWVWQELPMPVIPAVHGHALEAFSCRRGGGSMDGDWASQHPSIFALAFAAALLALVIPTARRGQQRLLQRVRIAYTRGGWRAIVYPRVTEYAPFEVAGSGRSIAIIVPVLSLAIVVIVIFII